MSRICCPMCGSDEIETIQQEASFTPPPNSTFPKPPMHNLMQYVVNYAAMGASGVRLIRGQKPVIYVIGALVGGAIGCAACFLNHMQEQIAEPTLKESSRPHTLYECLECEYRFAMKFEQGEQRFNAQQHSYFK
ncbi:hypothetical protein [Acinetobacter gerneri]|uniref:Uncharacterized protein n=1 Tax=Acinetobacter gerneri DSM 14967 = CIP 107464 = MTCC 9824 TaxID=1120926 RepID=N8ZNF5_9GAMM|nr:hypothetical protein [Acinetobacter gerneri]ENV33293.1 hypothetical protein F960_02320 [Acinetobacter gerneri DSM 14967 = CIP 107464 = MTCC 9824]